MTPTTTMPPAEAGHWEATGGAWSTEDPMPIASGYIILKPGVAAIRAGALPTSGEVVRGSSQPHHGGEMGLRDASLSNLEALLEFDPETRDESMALMQQQLRSGDAFLAIELAFIASPRRQGGPFSVQQRAIAIEALAAARAPQFDGLVARLVLEALVSSEPSLQLAGIAAIGNLPGEYGQSFFSPLLRDIAAGGATPDRLRSAARAALQA